MRLRSQRAATLSLIAVCLLIIAGLGIGVFFLVKLLGGGREVANATDAGVLNVAKQSSSAIKVTPPKQFMQCSDPPGTQINMLTFNRCVAQTMLVGLNAKDENTPEAATNARAVAAELLTLSTQLTNALQDLQVQSKFCSDLANANNTKLFGNSSVDMSGFKIAFMKSAQSTNVFIVKGTIPGSAPPNLYSKGTIVAPDGSPYMAGYVDFSLMGGPPIMGVPVLPQQKPHLVSLFDFNAQLTPPAASAVPNAFKVDAKSQDKKTMSFGGAVACAIVGSLDRSYKASIPGGYIEFANLPGKSTPWEWSQLVLASDSIFNDQVYYGIDVAPLPDGSYVFSRHTGEIQAWIDYNSSGANPAMYPPTLTVPAETNLIPAGYPLEITLRQGCSKGNFASENQAKQVTWYTHCTAYSFAEPKDKTCVDALDCMKKVYGSLQTDYGQNPPDGLCNVELMKAGVINGLRDTYNGTAKVPAPSEPSGLRYYDHEKTYICPPLPSAFAQDGTVMQLIDQASACKSPSMLEMVAQRCREILPGVTDTEVRQLLSSPAAVIPMGKKGQTNVLYLYLNGNALTISGTKPNTYSAVKPDGPDPLNSNCMKVSYDPMWKQINSRKTPDSVGGDTGVWDAPFLQPPQVNATDNARWQPSSGSQNLLGRLEFSQDTAGGGDFSAPN